MSNLAVELLIDQRVKLLQEQHEMNEKFREKIGHLNAAIKQLRGLSETEPIPETKYDDESPDYIKGTEDGV